MPCDTRATVSVEFTDKINRERFLKVLEEEGWRRTRGGVYVKGDTTVEVPENGNPVFTGYDTRSINKATAALKKPYAARTVKDNAARFGFRVKENADGSLTMWK